MKPELFEFQNVTLLPHMGTETEESQHAMEVRALQNLKQYFEMGVGKDLIWEHKEIA